MSLDIVCKNVRHVEIFHYLWKHQGHSTDTIVWFDYYHVLSDGDMSRYIFSMYLQDWEGALA